MSEKEMVISNFIKERNELLTKIDNPECMLDIEKHCKKYSIPMPQDIIVILAGLHKARLYVENKIITDSMKEKSRKWLKEHNFKEEIY